MENIYAVYVDDSEHPLAHPERVASIAEAAKKYSENPERYEDYAVIAADDSEAIGNLWGEGCGKREYFEA